MENEELIFTYKHGALTCNKSIDGITQLIDGDSAEFYGGKYFVCETITKTAADHFAKLLGGRLIAA